jgi:hypothetical protein
VRRRWLLFFAVGLLEPLTGPLLLASEPQDKKKIVSATVGQVGAAVITSREVQIAHVLVQWFLLNSHRVNSKQVSGRVEQKANQGKLAKPSLVIPEYPSEVFAKALTQVILENVVANEAENFSVAQVNPEEIKQWAQVIQADFSNWGAWKSLDVTDGELESQISRRLRSQYFLRFKTESTGIKVSDSEIQDYYQRNKVRFGNLPLESFKESIRSYLTQARLEDQLKDWFEILKRKYRVRYIKVQ